MKVLVFNMVKMVANNEGVNVVDIMKVHTSSVGSCAKINNG